MKCPICENNLEIYEKKISSDDNQSIINKYAVCKICKKQWPLKKKEPKPVSDENTLTSADKSTHSNDNLDDSKTAKDDTNTPQDSSVTTDDDSDIPDDESDIPDDDSDILDADFEIPDEDPKSRAKRKKQKPTQNSKSKKKPGTKSAHTKGSPSKKNQKSTSKKGGKGKRSVFKVPRILLGLLSLIAFGYMSYQAVHAYFSAITIHLPEAQAIAYVVIAACALVSGIILLATAKGNSTGAYILPAIVYLAGGGYAFFYRGDSFILLVSSIAAAVLAVLLIILAFNAKRKTKASRR